MVSPPWHSLFPTGVSERNETTYYALSLSTQYCSYVLLIIVTSVLLLTFIYMIIVLQLIVHIALSMFWEIHKKNIEKKDIDPRSVDKVHAQQVLRGAQPLEPILKEMVESWHTLN